MSQIDADLAAFVRESNMIEGILREPTVDELHASNRFLRLFQVSVAALSEYQSIVAPNHPLREREDMNVRVGDHIAPQGGPNITRGLQKIVQRANSNDDPWKVHVDFETLHPYLDGNGRPGRILWAWQMQGNGYRPFQISFLHRWYYQTLSSVRR